MLTLQHSSPVRRYGLADAMCDKVHMRARVENPASGDVPPDVSLQVLQEPFTSFIQAGISRANSRHISFATLHTSLAFA